MKSPIAPLQELPHSSFNSGAKMLGSLKDLPNLQGRQQQKLTDYFHVKLN